MGKYNLPKLTRFIFPWFWQNETNMSLVDVIIEGTLDTVNNEYEDKEADVRQRVGYSISRLSLEDGLNDRFDNTLRRIEVSQGTTQGSGYIYNVGEVITTEQEIFIFDIGEELPELAEEAYFYNVGESGGGSATGFAVTVPIELQGQENEIRSYIEFVMIFGTDYTLIFL